MARKRRPGQKKLRTREHVIADLSINHVERHILRRGFSAERVEHDYGIDLLMFTYTDDGQIENGHVEFQVKATDRLRLLRDRKTVVCAVSSADVRLWIWEPLPVVLVVYDARADRAYWLYVQQYAERRGLNDSPDETVTFHIPISNRLNRAAVGRFRAFRDAVLQQVKGVIRHND